MIDQTIKIKSWNLPNRVVFQPMEGCDGTLPGGIGALTRRRYLRFAEADAAIIWFEAVSVCHEGRANPRQLFLHKETAEIYEKLLDDMREHAFKQTGRAPKIIVQLTHSGRFAKPDGSPKPLVAYRNPHWETGREQQPYQIVTDDDCKQVAEYYASASALAASVGFDGIDVKCCHGYLLNEFLSAFERPGNYGGSFEHRTRLFFDCLEAAKTSVPGHVLLAPRINACDGFPYPYGWGVMPQNEIDLSECKEILRMLHSRFGCELVNISLGNPYLIPHVNRPAHGLPEAPEVGMERIRGMTKELQSAFPALALASSGLSFPGQNCVAYAEEFLAEGVATLAGFGRMTLAYPGFYRDYQEHGTLDKAQVCLACGKCTELMRAGSVSGCPVRDEAYRPFYQKYVMGREDVVCEPL